MRKFTLSAVFVCMLFAFTAAYIDRIYPDNMSEYVETLTADVGSAILSDNPEAYPDIAKAYELRLETDALTLSFVRDDTGAPWSIPVYENPVADFDGWFIEGFVISQVGTKPIARTLWQVGVDVDGDRVRFTGGTVDASFIRFNNAIHDINETDIRPQFYLSYALKITYRQGSTLQIV